MFGLNDPFARINSIMNQFMMDPFAPPGQSANRNRNLNNNNNNQLSLRNNSNDQQLFDPFGMSSPFDRHHNALMQNPFSLMNQMMGNFDNVFRNFDQVSTRSNADPNSHVYSSSSVITYSNTGNGKPKIYQQSKQIQQGPGGVRETREMLRDSERGIEKVAIGHHIGDRAHIIERQKQNGQMEEVVNLENIDDDEVNSFNQEFESRLRSHNHHHYNNHRTHHHLNNNQPLAIEENRSKKDRKSKSKSKH